MSILQSLILERESKKISQSEVARNIGISKQLMSRLESKKSIPNMDWIEKYADYLGFEVRLLKK